MIKINKLNFAYGKHAVIDDLTAEIARGSFVALYGANGAGKSTLLKLLSGFLPSATQTIQIDGRNLDQLRSFERARSIAFVAADLWMEMSFSVREIVAMGRYPHLGFLAPFSDKDERAIAAALELTQLQSLADRPYDELSGGQRQLCLIARAIAQEAPVMLLDEPTSHLDLKHRRTLMQTLTKLMQRKPFPTTIVMATHDYHLSQQVASHIWLLKSGKLLAAGDAKTTLSRDNLEQTFDCPIEITTHPQTSTVFFQPKITKPKA